MIRTLGSAAIFLIVIYVLLALFAEHVKRNGMFFPDRYPSGDWSPHLPVAPEDVYFTTPDGVRLHAWLFRAAPPDAPLMIYFHGNAGHLAGRGPIAAEFASRGVSVFVFDYRGFGRSEGRPSESDVHIDSLAAYDVARAHTGTHPGRIVLYGESIGGPYAARVGVQREACCAVIENSFPSLSRMANALYRPMPMGWFARGLLLTQSWLNSAGRPVLVTHGKRDEVVPIHLGKELYDGLSVEKEWFASEMAGHCQLDSAEGDRYYDTVVSFIRKHSG
jgi:fermentation-respiration switch protein FrsA (DUF1100 family)